jgi:hypothetical protein
MQIALSSKFDYLGRQLIVVGDIVMERGQIPKMITSWNNVIVWYR